MVSPARFAVKVSRSLSPEAFMPSRTAGPERTALAIHRELLAQAKAAVAMWASRSHNHTAATSILELLAPCARDQNGDTTLDALDAVFEEHRHLPESLVERLAALAEAAHALAQEAK
jgi:hypothetical protein